MAALALAAGCADVCQRAAGTAEALAAAGAPCGVGRSSQAFDVAACQATLPRCSAGELALIDAYEACVEALPRCAPEARAAFNAALSACATPMLAVDAGCFSP